jgi:hypothetical protein
VHGKLVAITDPISKEAMTEIVSPFLPLQQNACRTQRNGLALSVTKLGRFVSTYRQRHFGIAIRAVNTLVPPPKTSICPRSSPISAMPAESMIAGTTGSGNQQRLPRSSVSFEPRREHVTIETRSNISSAIREHSLQRDRR